MFPSDMVKNYPTQAYDMESEASSLNQHEKLFLIDNLKKLGLGINLFIIIKFGLSRRKISK